MPGTTTDDDPIAAANSAHPDPTNPPPASPRSRSSADRSSAVSSTNTSEPHRSPGQAQWPSYGTPQDFPEGDPRPSARQPVQMRLAGAPFISRGLPAAPCRLRPG